MKIAILYRSVTGHSKKIARAMSAEFGVMPQNIKRKPPQPDGVDLAFVVGGIYAGRSLPCVIEYTKTLMPSAVKTAVLVTSSASDKNGQDEVREILQANGIKVITEEYRCRGRFLFIKIGHPNKKEIAGAVEFARRMVQACLSAE